MINFSPAAGINLTIEEKWKGENGITPKIDFCIKPAQFMKIVLWFVNPKPSLVVGSSHTV